MPLVNRCLCGPHSAIGECPPGRVGSGHGVLLDGPGELTPPAVLRLPRHTGPEAGQPHRFAYLPRPFSHPGEPGFTVQDHMLRAVHRRPVELGFLPEHEGVGLFVPFRYHIVH